MAWQPSLGKIWGFEFDHKPKAAENAREVVGLKSRRDCQSSILLLPKRRVPLELLVRKSLSDRGLSMSDLCSARSYLSVAFDLASSIR